LVHIPPHFRHAVSAPRLTIGRESPGANLSANNRRTPRVTPRVRRIDQQTRAAYGYLLPITSNATVAGWQLCRYLRASGAGQRAESTAMLCTPAGWRKNKKKKRAS